MGCRWMVYKNLGPHSPKGTISPPVRFDGSLEAFACVAALLKPMKNVCLSELLRTHAGALSIGEFRSNTRKIRFTAAYGARGQGTKAPGRFLIADPKLCSGRCGWRPRSMCCDNQKSVTPYGTPDTLRLNGPSDPRTSAPNPEPCKTFP